MIEIKIYLKTNLLALNVSVFEINIVLELKRLITGKH